MRAVVLHADSREALTAMDDASVDSCVCDPPYALVSIGKRFGAEDASPAKAGASGVYARASAGFMGQKWDTGEVAFDPAFWREVLRVLKPGGHLLAFGGTRTYHRLVCAIEDAGFEIRDTVSWLYGSGFPKSHNQADEWEGWGTALKPACELICLGRKPLIGTVAATLAAHGCGALNIAATRVNATGRPLIISRAEKSLNTFGDGLNGSRAAGTTDTGRWPANVVHDGSEEVLAAFPDAPGQMADASTALDKRKTQNVYGNMTRAAARHVAVRPDSGSAARFFYCAKASKRDREDGNSHPTVKPTALMRWLVRLITPPGGTVLDPFTGSGSTGKAALLEGFNFIGIEREAAYVEIARRRIEGVAGVFA